MYSLNKRWHPEKKRSSKRTRQLEAARIKKRLKVVVTEEASSSSSEEFIDENSSGQFLLVHSSVWPKLFGKFKCNECNQRSMEVNISHAFGSSSKIIVSCQNCEWVAGDSFSSPRAKNNHQAPFLVNKRLVESMNSVGVGFAALERICSVMAMPCMAKSAFHTQLKLYYKETKLLKLCVLQSAQSEVCEAYKKIDPSVTNTQVIDASVSYDGTWQRRGYKSLHGVGIVIDLLTGLVLDFEVLSKFCLSCTIAASTLKTDSDEYQEWRDKHKVSGECEVNFKDSSGAMESAAAEIIWKRSIEVHNMRYKTMLSDGDSKTWLHLQNISPYGKDVCIEKEECINHVSKRLGKALRDAAKKDSLGGHSEGALTENVIKRLNGYYRKAIVNNKCDIVSMKREIMAALYHCGSTDKKPNHRYCPHGENSWCFFNRACALQSSPHSHASMSVRLNPHVIEKIKPIYDRLTEDALLLRCYRGKTQNANESLHSVIWHKCPKETFVSKKRIEIAVTNAVSEFNNGVLKTVKMRHALRLDDIPDSTTTLSFAEERDKQKLRTKSAESVHKQKLRRQSKRGQLKTTSSAGKDNWYGAGEY